MNVLYAATSGVDPPAANMKIKTVRPLENAFIQRHPVVAAAVVMEVCGCRETLGPREVTTLIDNLNC